LSLFNYYVDIMKIRFEDSFECEIQMEESCKKYLLPKLTIQPLLENAITHGMAGSVEDGLICVDARREGEDLVIDVTDNGVGIRPEIVSTLLDENRPALRTNGSGIGVKNVHQRIFLTFGRKYGLTILSEPDEGTTVRVRLPALNEAAAEHYRQEDSL